MDMLWLGYDGVSVRFTDVSAVLLYHPSLDRRIAVEYGHVPANVRAVVVTVAGAFLPSSLSIEQLRGRLARWRNMQSS